MRALPCYVLHSERKCDVQRERSKLKIGQRRARSGRGSPRGQGRRGLFSHSVQCDAPHALHCYTIHTPIRWVEIGNKFDVLYDTIADTTRDRQTTTRTLSHQSEKQGRDDDHADQQKQGVVHRACCAAFPPEIPKEPPSLHTVPQQSWIDDSSSFLF